MKKSVNTEFCEHANEYNSYNIIQQIVSRALVRELEFQPKRILELGCGSGQVFKNIKFPFEYYKAVDFSASMCEIHPKHDSLELYCLDFDREEFLENIKGERYDIVLSSSALQWSKNLQKIIKALSEVSDTMSLVLFTSNSFKTIFEITKKRSPILSLEEIKAACDSWYTCEYEVLEYNLEFDSKKKMFDYIKNSGVGGGNSTLSYKEAKNLYPYNYLEFEVVFIKGKRC